MSSTTKPRSMSIDGFNSKVQKGGFKADEFIAANMAWLKAKAGEYKLQSMVSDYESNKILPTMFLTSFAKTLLEKQHEANLAIAKQKLSEPIKEAKQQIISCTVYIQRFDKEKNDYLDEWDIYSEKNDNGEEVEWVSGFETYREGENWLLNKLHNALSPRVKGVLTDFRFSEKNEKEYTPFQGDKHKTQKLGGSPFHKTNKVNVGNVGNGLKAPKPIMKAKGDHFSGSKG